MPDDFAYQLVWSLKARHALKELGRKAIESGTGPELARVVRAIIARLKKQPISLGKIYRSSGSVE